MIMKLDLKIRQKVTNVELLLSKKKLLVIFINQWNKLKSNTGNS